MDNAPPVISADEAAPIAGELLEAPADDPVHPREPEELPAGRLVVQHGWDSYRDGTSKVIQRSAKVVVFGSGVPLQAITGEYAEVREKDGRPEITSAEAARRAATAPGAPAADPERPWELVPFNYGRPIAQHGADRRRRTAAVERSTGQPEYFTPPVPLAQLADGYGAIRGQGTLDERWAPPQGAHVPGTRA